MRRTGRTFHRDSRPPTGPAKLTALTFSPWASRRSFTSSISKPELWWPVLPTCWMTCPKIASVQSCTEAWWRAPPKCARGLGALRRSLVGARRTLGAVAGGHGLGVVAAGTVPLVDPLRLAITPTDRYQRMLDDYQMLVREQLICGAQVHVQVADRDLAVAIAGRLTPYSTPAARIVGQLSILVRRGQRLRQHSLLDLAALAYRRVVRGGRVRHRA